MVQEVIGALGSSIVNPIVSIWSSIIAALPGLIAAIIILIIGYVVAWAISFILERFLEKINLDNWIVQETHMKQLAGAFRLSHLLSILSRWFIFILFWPPAAELVSLHPLAAFLNTVALWLPHAIAAILIAYAGLVIAEHVYFRINAVKGHASAIIASSSKIIIFIATVLIALRQIGIDVNFAESSFLIILAGIMLGLALAFGIGYGDALKGEAKKSVAKIKKYL